MMLDIEPVVLAIREATAADLDDVLAMHRRCSRESLYRRYVSGVGTPPAALLARLLAAGTVVAIAAGGPDDGRLVGMASLVGDPAEAAILVEDAWQRRGVGTRLARRLAGTVRGKILVHVLAGNQPAGRTIRRLQSEGTLSAATFVERDGPLLTWALEK
ncbi:MAG: GNAT family N-acetyltransferase [Hamadaea sp.]|uniref:GNAT family N-acetyltransferase n=1 Tax=Hamadaea sp. TaxID=2024425 RepID=UPI0018282224|nr:GNAT family N-acetyltransferase [Hamadaea sp.]NUR69376.1 GNAT family N-acetyltransferase [Hamadaea sp.]NUT23193.1 GNAT family N-acetyltransferase [Hamadaea sp.]